MQYTYLVFDKLVLNYGSGTVYRLSHQGKSTVDHDGQSLGLCDFFDVVQHIQPKQHCNIKPSQSLNRNFGLIIWIYSTKTGLTWIIWIRNEISRVLLYLGTGLQTRKTKQRDSYSFLCSENFLRDFFELSRPSTTKMTTWKFVEDVCSTSELQVLGASLAYRRLGVSDNRALLVSILCIKHSALYSCKFTIQIFCNLKYLRFIVEGLSGVVPFL